MRQINLTDSQVTEIEEVVSCAIRQHTSVSEPKFLQRCSILAQGLPEHLRMALNDFRLTEPGACLISGFPVFDNKIGATPSHWSSTSEEQLTLREEAFFILCASLIGDVFGWSSQQGGRLVHEVVPIKGHEHLQINSASNSALLWHTEDAFHPYRADYIGLMCLRNTENIETTLASVRDVELDEGTQEILFQPRFILKPDESHLPENRDPNFAEDPERADVLVRSYNRINQMLRCPEKVSVLFGEPNLPYIRLDSAEVDKSIDDPEAMDAVALLMKEIDAHLHGLGS